VSSSSRLVQVHRPPPSLPADPDTLLRCALALDEVTDPQNLGSILRSAFFFGVDEVIICSKNSAPLSPIVSKASAGALEVMTVRSANNLMRLLDDSKSAGWQVVGTSLGEGAIALESLPLQQPTILVMGNEGHGLRQSILSKCDHKVHIPCGRGSNALVDSLNVSVATGVLLDHLRQSKSPPR
jgi:21S rRNA (GM2251-2'-O)-methyltransferase